MDEAAVLCGLGDDTRIILDVPTGWDFVGQVTNGAVATDLFELVAFLQLISERDEIGRLPALVELEHRSIDDAMRIAVEVVGPQELDHLLYRVGLDQDASQDAALSLDVLWQELFHHTW